MPSAHARVLASQSWKHHSQYVLLSSGSSTNGSTGIVSSVPPVSCTCFASVSTAWHAQQLLFVQAQLNPAIGTCKPPTNNLKQTANKQTQSYYFSRCCLDRSSAQSHDPPGQYQAFVNVQSGHILSRPLMIQTSDLSRFSVHLISLSPTDRHTMTNNTAAVLH